MEVPQAPLRVEPVGQARLDAPVKVGREVPAPLDQVGGEEAVQSIGSSRPQVVQHLERPILTVDPGSYTQRGLEPGKPHP